MFLPFDLRVWEEAEEASWRVTARRVKEGLLARALMTELPCLPVAPVMRRVLDMVIERMSDLVRLDGFACLLA